MWNMLELSGRFIFLSTWRDLLSFSMPVGTEKIAGLGFARRGGGGTVPSSLVDVIRAVLQAALISVCFRP